MAAAVAVAAARLMIRGLGVLARGRMGAIMEQRGQMNQALFLSFPQRTLAGKPVRRIRPHRAD
jgi:hypothetical protein